MNKRPEIYIATVLLERNRWGSRMPTFKVSEWTGRFADAGFDGIELWENHLLLAEESEWKAVAAGPSPVKILNTYCGFDDEAAEGRAHSAGLARYLEAPAVKFNFGKDPERISEYLHNLSSWCEDLPDGCRLLCECHPDTVLEVPETAAGILKPMKGEVEIIVHAFSQDNGELLQRWLASFGPDVAHVHANFRNSPPIERGMDILKSFGFTGSWSVEFCEGVDEPPEDMSALMSTAAGHMQRLRRALS